MCLSVKSRLVKSLASLAYIMSYSESLDEIAPYVSQRYLWCLIKILCSFESSRFRINFT